MWHGIDSVTPHWCQAPENFWELPNPISYPFNSQGPFLFPVAHLSLEAVGKRPSAVRQAVRQAHGPEPRYGRRGIRGQAWSPSLGWGKSGRAFDFSKIYAYQVLLCYRSIPRPIDLVFCNFLRLCGVICRMTGLTFFCISILTIGKKYTADQPISHI